MHDSALPVPRPLPYRGPERRAARADAWIGATLDELDYGMLLLADGRRLVHANHAARLELDGDHPLQLVNGDLCARRACDIAPLANALTEARERGLRRLLTLGDEARRVGLSIVPLPPTAGDAGSLTLLLLGRQQVCETLSVHGFGRAHGLTAAEQRVLSALCRGVPPGSIAAASGVAISTIRTQISGIRHKTGADSIRALVGQVAVLPPLRGVLRSEQARTFVADGEALAA